jgi:hypothetical protein
MPLVGAWVHLSPASHAKKITAYGMAVKSFKAKILFWVESSLS